MNLFVVKGDTAHSAATFMVGTVIIVINNNNNDDDTTSKLDKLNGCTKQD